MPSESPLDRFQQLWQAQERPPMELAVEQVALSAASFRRTIRRRNAREYAAAAIVVAFFSWHAAHADGMLVRAACAAIIVGTFYVVWYLRRHGSAEPGELAACTMDHLEAHRRELERQRDLLASVWRWYLGPLVPGFVLFTISVPIEQSRTVRGWISYAIATGIGAAVFFGIARLNRMGARKLQREIDALLPPALDRTR
jgi:hypothetical protein